ncbi:hypothetical protein JTE90_015701 [Oedothorax gibbosus]|uniref:Uncharacterized protein n=1 Tax=Oedothorax gibbosus TaxID=931172 RepID=A0AAV6TGD0_9ARAC|nr:hypothetical protein JTE90_015701 [Oedothorax gibbosus]
MNSVPISDEPFQGHELLQRKKNSSPGPRSTSPSFGCVTALGPKDYLRVRWGILTPFPFGRQRDKTRCVCVSADVLASPPPPERISRSLGPTAHVQLLSHGNPSAASVLKDSHLSIWLLPQICTGGGSRRLHARHLQRTPRDPPTHCVKTHEGKLCRSGRLCPTLERHPFSGLRCFGR